MSKHVGSATGYLLSEDGHAELCRLTEHLYLLACLTRAYAPGAPDEEPIPIPPTHWAASLQLWGDTLERTLAALRWQGP